MSNKFSISISKTAYSIAAFYELHSVENDNFLDLDNMTKTIPYLTKLTHGYPNLQSVIIQVSQYSGLMDVTVTLYRSPTTPYVRKYQMTSKNYLEFIETLEQHLK